VTSTALPDSFFTSELCAASAKAVVVCSVAILQAVGLPATTGELCRVTLKKQARPEAKLSLI
jgi:hypothetical protein